MITYFPTFTPGSCSVQKQADLWPLNSSPGAVGIKGLAQGPCSVADGGG